MAIKVSVLKAMVSGKMLNLWCWSSILLLWLLWLGWPAVAQAESLSERLSHFPDWQNKPPVEAAIGDLVYPDWFAGDWIVVSTLVDLVAPLAPEVVTPGFEGNRQFLHQPIVFQARFQSVTPTLTGHSFLQGIRYNRRELVADRAYNGFNLAEALLGKGMVQAVKVDPSNPNRQLTLLKGDRQLLSLVQGRASEAPTADTFITTEQFQQEFRGTTQIYFNQVENTTAYQRQRDPATTAQPAIAADQVTAIYLSPQDPNYFKAGDRPVALYRYRLEFLRPDNSSKSETEYSGSH